MMNKNVFKQYIASSDFRNLFTQEMGWNNPRGQVDFEFTIDDEVYEFKQIADRNGFQAITCAVSTIPTSSVCKKIDTKLRRLDIRSYVDLLFDNLPDGVSRPMILKLNSSAMPVMIYAVSSEIFVPS